VVGSCMLVRVSPALNPPGSSQVCAVRTHDGVRRGVPSLWASRSWAGDQILTGSAVTNLKRRAFYTLAA
jgi:hypothetical protein